MQILTKPQQELLAALQVAESKSTQGTWILREHGSDCFVERPKMAGEPYGVEILGDDYAHRRTDAEFIVLAKQFILSLKTTVTS